MTSGRETILITVLCAVSGWLGGAASARGSFFDALLGVDSLKWMLVLSFVGLVVSKPWRLGAHSKYWLVWGLLAGLSSGLLSLVTYFLIWPYEGHGRERVFTTVVAMLVSYPALFIGLPVASAALSTPSFGTNSIALFIVTINEFSNVDKALKAQAQLNWTIRRMMGFAK